MGLAPARTGGSGLSPLGYCRPLAAYFCLWGKGVEKTPVSRGICTSQSAGAPELCVPRSRAHYEISTEMGLSSEASLLNGKPGPLLLCDKSQLHRLKLPGILMQEVSTTARLIVIPNLQIEKLGLPFKATGKGV